MQAAIGFFDSGVGGISVLRQAEQRLVNESFIYVADSNNAPYGQQSADFIRSRSELITKFLISQNIKIMVIACNTATSYAAKFLRDKYPNLPIIAMEPAIKPALQASQTKQIAVLATPQTLASHKFKRLTQQLTGEILSIPCPGLVELIEAGNINNNLIINRLEQLIKPIFNTKTDSIVLGCTHYSLVKPLIKKIAGNNITIFETVKPVVNQLQHILQKYCLINSQTQPQATNYYSNGEHSILKQMFAINTVHQFTL